MDAAGRSARDALVAALIDALAGVPAQARIVAVSGGRDSLTLLELLSAVHVEAGLAPPRALHVHHGLSPAADLWARTVVEQGHRLGVATEVVRVQVERTGEGLEAAARRARYAAFADYLGDNEHLLLAQHGDDQVETVLLRLLRGAGPRGLAGMPGQRRLGAGWLLRPWLALPGAQLEQAARALGLRWVEDPANGDASVDRAFLRGQLLPQLGARWPGAAAAILRSAEACADTEAALAELLPLVPTAGAPLALRQLRGEASQRHALLRAWFAGARQPMPPRSRLETLLTQLEAARDATLVVAFGAVEVRRYADQLYMLARHRPAPRPARMALAPGACQVGCGLLELLPSGPGAGVLRMDLPAIDIRFRAGGERLRLPDRRGMTLKRLFQDLGVPPWERGRIPLVCAGDAVLAVADLALCTAGRGAPEAAGLRVRWTPESALPGCP